LRAVALGCALALGCVVGAAAAPQPVPRYQVDGAGLLVVSVLPEVLSRPEVRPHLTTGLTTSFVLEVTATRQGAPKRRGLARIDVRWEPWDEVFFTVVIADGRARRETVGSFERLTAWWRELELVVARGLGAGNDAGRWRVEVELGVVPFSQSEERDAQRWFAGALQDADAEQPSSAAAPRLEGSSGLDDVVDLLMATSIQRRSIVRYAWQAQPVRRTANGP
jgi:hypothetical protein